MTPRRPVRQLFNRSRKSLNFVTGTVWLQTERSVQESDEAKRAAGRPTDDKYFAQTPFQQISVFPVDVFGTLFEDPEEAILSAIGASAAHFLESTLYDGEVIGISSWSASLLRMVDALHQVGAAHYIKKDLQPFLPDGYPNPLRVKQHHGAST